MSRLRARFDGRVLIPLEPVELAIGEIIEIEIYHESGLALGSAELLRRLMKEEPHCSPEDVAEMERVIEEGKLPVRY